MHNVRGFFYVSGIINPNPAPVASHTCTLGLLFSRLNHGGTKGTEEHGKSYTSLYFISLRMFKFHQLYYNIYYAHPFTINPMQHPISMRKLFLILAVIVFASSLTSCVTMKRDCQGVRHVKLKNGIYI